MTRFFMSLRPRNEPRTMKAKRTAVSRKKSQRIGDDEISLFFISDLRDEREALKGIVPFAGFPAIFGSGFCRTGGV